MHTCQFSTCWFIPKGTTWGRGLGEETTFKLYFLIKPQQQQQQQKDDFKFFGLAGLVVFICLFICGKEKKGWSGLFMKKGNYTRAYTKHFCSICVSHGSNPLFVLDSVLPWASGT